MGASRQRYLYGVGFGKTTMGVSGTDAAGVLGHVKRYLVAVIKMVEVHDRLPSSKRENAVSQSPDAYGRVVRAMSSVSTGSADNLITPRLIRCATSAAKLRKSTQVDLRR